jgi:hypothetical protein
MIELTTSTTDPGLSITIFSSVASRKGPHTLLGYLSILHQTTLLLSLELSGSLVSSSSIFVSLSLVKITAEKATFYPN